MGDLGVRAPQVRTGWISRLSRLVLAVLLLELITGLCITFAPFHAAIEWGVLGHTAVGIVTLVPVVWYLWLHWLDYRRYLFSHIILLGYVAGIALLVCLISGVVVTWQGLFGTHMSQSWRKIHLISTYATLGTSLPHVLFALARVRHDPAVTAARIYILQATSVALFGTVLFGAASLLYSGTRYVNTFPEGYEFPFGKERPFAPSLAQTSTGGAFDARSLSGSTTCGSARCHVQIVEEWKPSAHRYAAMDTLFQGIQSVMAKQNGPESTRYCGGCHDPISLFSGTKNIFVENLTSLQGYNEGVSCLACHSVQQTDLQGNANYTVVQPGEYLWQWSEGGPTRIARDFLIRTYPAQHNKLSKRVFKAPEYCAACHKQFIDKEVNRVGWVQLQNQYDNWATSHWNHKDDPRKTIECRECHMPLVDSTDPASGDAADYNRSPGDGKHRSHRFIGSNQLMPQMLQLEGWKEQVRLTERWLRGEHDIAEIRDKWAEGPVVRLALDVPTAVSAGQTIPIRVIMTSNKVGHDFPTGPLDIIQSWVELRVTDDQGRDIFTSGTRDEKNFIAPGTFMFKAEPVDQLGNLIDRHNLWEMVGVRFRRSLFPGYSDAAEYLVNHPSTVKSERGAPHAGTTADPQRFDLRSPQRAGRYHVTAVLQYRKVDQFLLNFLLGETSGWTSPVSEIARASAVVEVVSARLPE